MKQQGSSDNQIKRGRSEYLFYQTFVKGDGGINFDQTHHLI